MTRVMAVADWLTRPNRTTSLLEESGYLAALTWGVTATSHPFTIRLLVIALAAVTIGFTAGFIRGAVSDYREGERR